MKRILFLLLITSTVYADAITDLEHAIMKSNQEAVEKLLAGKITITRDEQVALINLATEIIKKRENKIFINSTRTTCFFNNNCLKSNDSYNRPIYWEKYLKNNTKLKTCRKSVLIFLLTGTISSVIAIVDQSANNSCAETFFGALTVSVLCACALLFYAIKVNLLEKHIILKHGSHLNARYNTAIQIRQLLYKIKARPS